MLLFFDKLERSSACNEGQRAFLATRSALGQINARRINDSSAMSVEEAFNIIQLPAIGSRKNSRLAGETAGDKNPFASRVVEVRSSTIVMIGFAIVFGVLAVFVAQSWVNRQAQQRVAVSEPA